MLIGDIMDFEKYYNKLPGFIKYNNFILNFFLKISKRIRKFNLKSQQQNSQHELFNLLLLHCDIKTKGTLRKVQILYVEFLRFFDNVCRKHGIEYWLETGTLLGAIRHGGFILWDDDIDVSLLRKDYDKLLKILPQELSKYDYLKEECGLTLPINNHENYFKDFKDYTYFKDDENFPLKHRFLFLEFSILKPYIKIDIFPKDYLLDDKIDFYKKNYLSVKYRFNKEVQNGEKDFKEELKDKNSKLGLVDYETNYYAYTLDDLEFIAPTVFRVDETFPLKTISFEGYEFMCPCDIDSHLKEQYGENYMSIPNVIEHHDMLEFMSTQFSSKEELNQKIDDLTIYLKEINDSFFDEK